MTSVITFTPDGSAACLWTEAIPLAALGTLTIKRASTIEFNAERQQWEVRLADNPRFVCFAHESRDACLAWEVETINDRLAQCH